MEQLEHSEKRHDDDLGRTLPVEKVAEGQGGMCPDHAVDGGDGERDWQALGGDVLGLQQEGVAPAVEVGADDRKAT